MGDLSSVLNEMAYHLTVMGTVYLIAIPLLGVVIGLPLFMAKGQTAFATFLVRFAYFLAILLVVGVIANGVWASIAWNKMYVSRDPVVTFVPFFPFGQWVLDQTWAGRPGSLLGGWSIHEVQAVWWAVSLSAWAAIVAVFLASVRKFKFLSPNTLVPRDPNPRERGFGPVNSDR